MLRSSVNLYGLIRKILLHFPLFVCDSGSNLGLFALYLYQTAVTAIHRREKTLDQSLQILVMVSSCYQLGTVRKRASLVAMVLGEVTCGLGLMILPPDCLPHLRALFPTPSILFNPFTFRL